MLRTFFLFQCSFARIVTGLFWTRLILDQKVPYFFVKKEFFNSKEKFTFCLPNLPIMLLQQLQRRTVGQTHLEKRRFHDAFLVVKFDRQHQVTKASRVREKKYKCRSPLNPGLKAKNMTDYINNVGQSKMWQAVSSRVVVDISRKESIY